MKLKQRDVDMNIFKIQVFYFVNYEKGKK